MTEEQEVFLEHIQRKGRNRTTQRRLLNPFNLKLSPQLFVYGTLRRGGARAMFLRFPKSKLIADAKASGSLSDLGAYPGLLLGESNSSVIGEVYEVDDETLNKLDDFEASSHYWRKQVEISLGTDTRMCWTYEPNSEFYSPRT